MKVFAVLLALIAVASASPFDIVPGGLGGVVGLPGNIVPNLLEIVPELLKGGKGGSGNNLIDLNIQAQFQIVLGAISGGNLDDLKVDGIFTIFFNILVSLSTDGGDIAPLIKLTAKIQIGIKAVKSVLSGNDPKESAANVTKLDSDFKALYIEFLKVISAAPALGVVAILLAVLSVLTNLVYIVLTKLSESVVGTPLQGIVCGLSGLITGNLKKLNEAVRLLIDAFKCGLTLSTVMQRIPAILQLPLQLSGWDD